MSLLKMKWDGSERLIKYKPPHNNEVKIGDRWYPYVQIGNQLWLAENLDYKIDGQSNNYRYYNNDETTYGINGTYKCGLLYNWSAVSYLNNNKSTLLPEGWRIPDLEDFNSLISAISSQYNDLKAIDGTVTSNWPASWNGTDNKYGFNALPSGSYTYAYVEFNEQVWYWSIKAYGSQTAGALRLANNATQGFIDDGKSNYRALRLVKDAT